MAKSLKEVMIGKSDVELTEYLNNFDKFTPDAIMEAVAELKRRGRAFTDEELTEIESKIEIRTKAATEGDVLFPSNSWRQDVVTDPNAPLLYSKGAIRAFSILGSTVFGSALLALNIRDTRKKWIVIGFGVAYTVVTTILLNVIPSKIIWALCLNSAGGMGLTTTFWDMYIGKEIKYRAKPIWRPLLVSLIISIPLLLAVLYG